MEASDIEAKLRRVDLMRSPDDMADWFGSRFPDSISDVRALEAWWKTASEDERQSLYLSIDDLKIDHEAAVSTEHYPEQVELGHLTLPASYQFAPGKDEDGVTVQVPLEALMQLDPENLEWTVPGAVEEKVEAMVRGLPKSIRRQLVPIPDFVRDIMPLIDPNSGGLSQSVARCVTKRTGIAIDALFWADQQIDPRLKLRIEVVGSDGLVIDADRDLAKLQDRLSDQVSKLQLTDVQEVYNDWPAGLDLACDTSTVLGGIEMKKFKRFTLQDDEVLLTSIFDPKDATVQNQEAVAQLLVARSADLFRFLKTKDAAYQKALIALCSNETDQHKFNRLIVLSCLELSEEVLSEAQFVDAKKYLRKEVINQAVRISVSLESAMSRYRSLKQRLGGKVPAPWLSSITAMKSHIQGLCEAPLYSTPPGPSYRSRPIFARGRAKVREASVPPFARCPVAKRDRGP